VREEKARREAEEMRERAVGYVGDLLRATQDQLDRTLDGIADALKELETADETESAEEEDSP
jgi:hypothetical protein